MRNVSRVDTLLFGQAEKLANIVDHWVHEIADGLELHQAIDQSADTNDTK